LWTLDEMERGGARPRNAQKVESDLLKDISTRSGGRRSSAGRVKVGDRFVSFTALNEIKYLLRKEAFPGLSELETARQGAGRGERLP
jgi:hypothetical protein